MHLTSFTDIALRVVMHLASGGPTRTTEIAEQLNLSYTHASKVVTALQQQGVVETRRGRKGGLSLSAAGRASSVGQIVRALSAGEVVECEGSRPCPLRSGCRLRGALREAQEAFYRSLDQVTIAELIEPPTQQLLLSIGRQR